MSLKTCGDCKHFKWAKGLTGRKLRKMAGRCAGRPDIPQIPIAFIPYMQVGQPLRTQLRPCYHDSQHASQCAAFEAKEKP